MTGRLASRLHPLYVPALCTVMAAAVLIGLGVWQLHRLAWKDALLARIESRSKSPPHPLPPSATWSSLKPEGYEYDHVVVTGTFDHAAETLILRASTDGPGYHVITPLKLDGGGAVLVDRGFIPIALQDPRTRESGQAPGEVRVTGVLRAPEPRNAFTPADDPARGVFFTRDPVQIAAHDKLVGAAPFSVDVDPSMVNPGGWPKPVDAGLAIPNNHLSYALTWFGRPQRHFGVLISKAL